VYQPGRGSRVAPTVTIWLGVSIETSFAGVPKRDSPARKTMLHLTVSLAVTLKRALTP